MEDKIYGKTHCPYCEKPLVQDVDWDKYQEAGDGDHLCWNYPSRPCFIGPDGFVVGEAPDPEERLIDVLNQRDIDVEERAVYKIMMLDLATAILHVNETASKFGIESIKFTGAIVSMYDKAQQYLEKHISMVDKDQ